MSAAVERYLNWQAQTGRGHPLTPKSLRPLRQSLARWSAWMGEMQVGAVTARDIENYLAWLRGDHDFGDGPRAGLKEQSIRTQYGMIRALCMWLMERNYALHSSLFKGSQFRVPVPDVKDEIYDVYGGEELGLLWEAIGAGDRANRYRNYAIFATLLGAGLRLGELCDLDDEDFNGLFLRVRDPKNRTPRFVPITATVQEAIREYMVKRRAPLRDTSERAPLFLADHGERLTESGLQSLMGRLRDHANQSLQKPMTAGTHKFRHTYATYTVIRERKLKGECNIWELSKRLGHKSIKITERYLTLTDPSLQVVEPWTHFIYVSSGAGEVSERLATRGGGERHARVIG